MPRLTSALMSPCVASSARLSLTRHRHSSSIQFRRSGVGALRPFELGRAERVARASLCAREGSGTPATAARGGSPPRLQASEFPSMNVGSGDLLVHGFEGVERTGTPARQLSTAVDALDSS